MIYKLISSREVVTKVFSDLDLKDEGQRISDIQEWISEAVEKIGAVTQMRRLVSGSNSAPYLEIKSYQASMPDNLARLNSVSYSTSIEGPWVPMSKSTSTLTALSEAPIDGPKERIIQDQKLVDTVKSLYQKYVDDPVYTWFNKMDDATALEILNTNQNVRTILTNLINAAGTKGSIRTTDILKYSIKPGYIITNTKSGYLKLSYDAMYTDDDGYLLIPDLASYKEAIFWYVAMKLQYPEYANGRMPQYIYHDTKRSWNFYCKQAYAEAMMPDQDDMENIKNIWVKLVPDMNMRDSDYADMGNSQTIYNQTY